MVYYYTYNKMVYYYTYNKMVYYYKLHVKSVPPGSQVLGTSGPAYPPHSPPTPLPDPYSKMVYYTLHVLQRYAQTVAADGEGNIILIVAQLLNVRP